MGPDFHYPPALAIGGVNGVALARQTKLFPAVPFLNSAPFVSAYLLESGNFAQ